MLSTLGGCGNGYIDPRVFRSGRLRSRERRPDGKLYAVVGENADPALAQDPLSPMGKVLRMNPDGSAPSDNPFYGNPAWDELVYTYGHRNMFGLAFHPVTSQAFVTENGPNCNDEVSALTAGENFGWGSTATCGTPPSPPGNTNRDGPNPIFPIWWWGTTICPTNVAVYGGPYFPAWQGDLFMGDCNYGRLHRLDLVAPDYDTVASDTIIWTSPDIILDVEAGPDGAIWITTIFAIHRYFGQAPAASFTAAPNPVTAGTLVDFDGSASGDPDGMIVSYAWDFGDSNTGSGATTSHVYGTPGTFHVVLTVTDNESFTSTETQDIVVNASPGPPQIVSSDPGLGAVTLVVGTTRTFTVTASDPDGDVLTYTWRIDGTVAGGNVSSLEFIASAQGTYVVNVTVSDGTFTTAREWTVLVVPSAPPQIVSSDPGLGPVTLVVGTTRTFAVTASDPEGDVLTYAWRINGTLTGGNVSSLEFIASAPGTYVVNVTVSDGTSTAAREWTVLVVAPEPPQITFPSGLVWPLILLVLAAFVLLLVWGARRTKGRREPPPPGTR